MGRFCGRETGREREAACDPAPCEGDFLYLWVKSATPDPLEIVEKWEKTPPLPFFFVSFSARVPPISGAEHTKGRNHRVSHQTRV